MSLSSRAEQALSTPGVKYYEIAVTAWRDVYDSEENPHGYINLSVAENKVSAPLIAEKISSTSPIPASQLSYTDAHGSEQARHVVANFFQHYITKCTPPVSSDQLVLLNGAGSIINMLSTLLCDADDHVIVCGPGYRGLQSQLYSNANTNITIANLDIDQHGSFRFPPIHTVTALQDALDRAQQSGHVVKAVLIISPHNPTGEVLSPSLIRDITNWTRSNSLHAIFDEVYALSVHDENVTFSSIAQVLDGNLGDDVHIVWSMSKDLCSSGVRLGVLYSQNKRLIKACVKTFSITFSSASRLVEWSLIDMFADFEWLDGFIIENNRRLRQAYERSVRHLNELQIPFAPASAGFFILADFRKFMTDNTKEAEFALWNKMADAKVLLSPSSEFYASHFGFFRICFAAVQPQVLDVAWSKLRTALL